jgi:DNA repair protein RadC
MNRSVKSLPAEERPRERLVRFGADALSTIELLAILLGSGTKSFPVMELASELLTHFGSVEALSQASLEELQEVKGIGLAKAIQLQAVFALSGRKEERQHVFLETPDKVYSSIRHEMEKQFTEVLLIILRDVRRQQIHREVLSKGTLTELIMHPRDVFHMAIKHRAHSLIIAHNHPSGDPTPSSRDFEMTQILTSAGRMIGIPLADHLVVGRGKYISFYARGLLPSRSEPY